MSCVGLNRQSDYRATLRVVMPFRTLCLLLATQSVATCIPTRSVRNDHLNYRADVLHRSEQTIRLSCDAQRRHAVPDALRPLGDAERRDLHSHAGA
ncbi:hypothetical protein B1F73_25820 [Pseudomonas syringae]|nr:hypothetical protein B1F77_07335 [Pseudomonas syringae]RXT84949.1 hypothetical protein B1F72_11735 [Pseudomonas syringae]RXT93368.1 hypothetical protein B1F73_25820 [Pseudomonas syringae]